MASWGALKKQIQDLELRLSSISSLESRFLLLQQSFDTQITQNKGDQEALWAQRFAEWQLSISAMFIPRRWVLSMLTMFTVLDNDWEDRYDQALESLQEYGMQDLEQFFIQERESILQDKEQTRIEEAKKRQ